MSTSSILDWNEASRYMLVKLKIGATSWSYSYTNNDVFHLSIQMLLIFIGICWLASIVTHNYSHVDRAWSILPVIYVWHFTIHAWLKDGQWNERLLLQSFLVTLWGMRLTYNFWRKGGYRLSEEDYRWAVLRTLMHPVLYQLFNVVFISGYQNILLFLIILPVYPAYLYRLTPLHQLDIIATVLFIGLLIVETVADEQQWRYYQTKYALIAKNETLTGDYKVGFNRSGLFAYSRHPNFFAEQSQWCVFYLFSVSSTGIVWNPTAIGAILLILLFQGSTTFTEWITAKKYPAYKEYQQTVSSQIPWFPVKTKKRVD